VVAYGFNYYFLVSGPADHACFFDTTFYPSDGFIRVGPTLYTTLPGMQCGHAMVTIPSVVDVPYFPVNI